MSEDRILTTHAGSLPRPDDLAEMIWAGIDGHPVDPAALSARIDSAVAEVVAKQRAAGVDIFTMGQYLQPSKKHLPVVEFITPETFKRLGEVAARKGFHQVVSSPLSRSSYHAEQAF